MRCVLLADDGDDDDQANNSPEAPRLKWPRSDICEGTIPTDGLVQDKLFSGSTSSRHLPPSCSDGAISPATTNKSGADQSCSVKRLAN